MTLLQKTLLMQRLNNKGIMMNIREVQTTITFDMIEKALSESMENSDTSVFNKVEIESIDEETKEVRVKLSRKGGRGRRNISVIESDNESQDKEPESSNLEETPEQYEAILGSED